MGGKWTLAKPAEATPESRPVAKVDEQVIADERPCADRNKHRALKGDVAAREASEETAAIEALDLFAFQVARQAAALTATLGGASIVSSSPAGSANIRRPSGG